MLVQFAVINMRSLVFFVGIFGAASSLKITSLTVPRYGDPRQPVTLSCHYKLQREGPPLYCVNWYMKRENILSYLPKRQGSILKFNTTAGRGVTGACNISSCTIKVPLPMAYNRKIKFTCEVTEDGPKFTFVNSTRELTVAVVPEEGPVITTVPANVHPGEFMVVNCSTAPGMPPARIYWFIDGIPVPHSCEMNSTQLSPPIDGAYISWSVLHIRAFQDRRSMEVRCEASQPIDPPCKRSGYRLIMLNESQRGASNGCSSTVLKVDLQTIILSLAVIILLH